MDKTTLPNNVITFADFSGFSEYIRKNKSLRSGLILKESEWRLRLLDDVGLDNVTMSGTARTLSGREAPWVRLATPIG